MPRIEKLFLEKFRGATQPLELAFDPKKKLILIFGENGTGKSTLIDAFDMVGNRRPGSLGDRSSTTPYSKFVPTIGCEIGQMTVQVQIAGHIWEAKFYGANINSSAQTSDVITPNIRILRRAKLLHLIDAEPAKRYEVLKQLIDVSGVEDTENQLSFLVAALDKEIKAAKFEHNNAKTQLDKLWQSEALENSDYRTWAQEKSSAQVSDLNERKLLLVTYIDSAAQADLAKIKYDTAIKEYEKVESAYQQAKLDVEQYVAVENISTNLVELFERAKEVLSSTHTSDDCPVCKQHIDHEALLADITSRLSSVNVLQTLNAKFKSTQQAQVIVKNVLQQDENSLIQVGQALFKAASAITLKNTHNKQDESLRTEWTVLHAINFIELRAKDKAYITSEKGNIERDLNLLNVIRQQYSMLINADKIYQEKKKLQENAKKILGIMRQERIKYTQKILDAVADECNRLYSIIHPKESIGISSLHLDPNRKASLLQEATFGTSSGVPPQAYFSESHLDTLGFCFWLAVVKYENPTGKVVIVLDDIFTSVDSAHFCRISDLLADEAKHFSQVIISTHSRNWRDLFKLGGAPGLSTQLIELQRWTYNRGICNFNSRLEVEELEKAIQSTPFDRQIVASKSGVLLEAILDRLALLFRRRLPRQPSTAYTLGELIDACKQLFDKLQLSRLMAESQEEFTCQESIRPHFAEVAKQTHIRNKVGAHFNLDGLEISDIEIENFGNNTVALFRALSCHLCGQIPNKRSGTHWECHCKSTRMLPLEVV